MTTSLPSPSAIEKHLNEIISQRPDNVEYTRALQCGWIGCDQDSTLTIKGQSYCKIHYQRRYRAKHREEMKEYDRRYRAEHREEHREASRRYHARLRQNM